MDGLPGSEIPAKPFNKNRYRSTQVQSGKIYFYPILFGIYPILSLWLANYDVTPVGYILRASIVTLLIILGVWLLLRLVRLSAGQVASVITISVAVFFTYGHSMNWLAKRHAEGITFLSPVTVTLFYIFAWMLGIWAGLLWMKRSSPVHTFLNVTSAILTVTILAQVIANEISFARLASSGTFERFDIMSQMQPPQQLETLPDVYYIILDGYGSEDSLLKFLEFDNSDFYQQLETRGFFVADSSTSNYANTAPSLASSLNFQYLDPLVEAVGSESGNYRPLREIIQNNQAMDVFDLYHYSTVAFETGFNMTEGRGADYYIQVLEGPNNFESMLLSNSLALLWTRESLAAQYRNRIPAVLERTAQLSDIPSPKFVFAHVMAAHPPFVFGKDGEVRSSAARVTIDEGSSAKDLLEEREAYQNQVLYANRLVIAMVDTILENSVENPVIVIQGDHGSGIYMDWQSAENTCFTERKSILNAYYFPGGKTELLYPTITPVNSFRVIFNTYLGTNLPLLADRNYFSLFESPYRMMDVTDKAGNCP